MPPRFTRRRFPTLVATTMLVAFGLTGCPWLPQNYQPGLTRTDLDRATESPDPADASKSAAAVSSASSTRASREVLAANAWVRTGQSMHADAPTATRRWQHFTLEELLSQPQPPRREFSAALTDGDPVVAANAAVALAMLGDPSVADRLAAAVRTATLKLPIRCAAIEALAGLNHPSRADLLRELLQQYGRIDPQSHSHYVAELHAELLHGLGRHADLSDQPQFLAALRSPSAEVRLAALQSLGHGVRGDLPVEVSDLRTDPDARVRAACMTILAQHPGPNVEEYLTGGLTDFELRVRIAAIDALAILKTDSARTKLRTLLSDSAELIRAAAVSALASAGDRQAVFDTASDKSWRVRLVVAKALASYPDRDTAALVRKFLSDPSAPVQQQAIQSLAAWPLEKSGPILLEAMGTNVYTTRKASAGLLAQRWTPATQFSADAPAERRSEILNQLQQAFRQQFGLVDPQSLAVAGAIRPALSEDVLAPVQLLVRRLSDPAIAGAARNQAIAELKALGAGGVDALEKVVLDRNEGLPPPVYRDVLPQFDPAFAALDRMTSDDVLVRRRAASDLAEMAAKRPLRPLAVARLAELATAETDQLVWQSALTVVANDGGEPAIRLAAAAIGHPSPEIRRRACENLAAHPDPSHAPVLLPALEDENEEVVVAAARALGLAGCRDDRKPLRRKLGVRSERIQLEVAIALVRLGDESGIAALERLSYSGEENVRCRVATAMGEIPSPSFVPILIRFLDDRQSVRVAALASLPKVVGQEMGGKVGSPAVRMAEHVALWKRWFQDRQ